MEVDLEDEEEEELGMISLRHVATDEVWDALVDFAAGVSAMKAAIEEQHDVPAARLRLVYKGRVLCEGPETLRELGVKEGAQLYLVVKEEEQRSTGFQQQQRNEDEVSIPLMGNMRASQLKAMAPMMEMMAQNPDMLKEMMGMMNPEMKKQMEDDPQLAAQLTDPRNLRMLTERMRNPGAMNDLSRGIDHQISYISNLPGGNAALERVTHMLESERPRERQTAAYSGPAAPASGPLPNPWARGQQRSQQQQQQQQRPTQPQPSQPQSSQVSSQPTQPPQQQQPVQGAAQQPSYEKELAMVKDMGFSDEAAILKALREANGDVDDAVNRLTDE